MDETCRFAQRAGIFRHLTDQLVGNEKIYQNTKRGENEKWQSLV